MLKIALVITAAIVTVLFIVFTYESDENLRETITLKGVYDERRALAEIRYSDVSNMTERVSLEVHGTGILHVYESSSFTDTVPFSSVPIYGWKSTPVVLSITHAEFGNITAKTEIYEKGQPVPPVIFGRP